MELSLASLNLRARLALLVGSLMTIVVVVISGVLIRSLHTNLDQAMTSKSQVMQDALKRKGIAVAQSVALSSSRAILNGNLVFLLDVIRSAMENDNEVAYAMIMDRDAKALVHSDPNFANRLLTTNSDKFAAAQTEVTTQVVSYNGAETLEVIAPFNVADDPWGTVRLGLSMRNVHSEIAQSEAFMREQIFQAVLFGVLAALVLLVLGSSFGVGAAAVLIQPLQTLLSGANRLREGNMDQPVVVEGSSPEFHVLARAFNDMTTAVKDREVGMQNALSEAREANRLKGEFLANVSHELRTPLNAIINVPEGLVHDYETHLAWHCEGCGADFAPDAAAPAPADDATETCPDCHNAMKLSVRAFYHGDPSQHYHYLQRLLQSAKHLLAVVTDILDFSKLEAGKMTVRCEQVQVAQVLSEMRDTVSVLASAKQIKLVWPDVTDMNVWADDVKLAQVMLNLMGNAIKFTPDKGRVELSVHADQANKQVIFKVIDNGMGIPSDKIHQLFESFRQVDGSHTRTHGGTGLGLAISRKLVDLHGGAIWCESSLGKGSTFSFFIPTLATAHTARVADGKAHHGRILLVDDDQTQLELLDNFLREEGYETEMLHTSDEAELHLGQKAFDLVIMDIMMPGKSGLSVLRNIKATARTKDIPVIISSAYHVNQDVVVGMGGVWLPKPWTRPQLMDCVKQQVGDALPAADPQATQEGGDRGAH